MKFSITFKYSNVTFKNKETKETVTYDTKAETGNTFTFDNVDEDVVLGIVKGIKDRKASQVFSYDDFRTNFVNVMARNKCKELYDKLDKGEWKIDDIAISNITIKDLEFTKPTMNAREVITVESKRKQVAENTYDNKLDEALNLLNEAAASLHMAMWDIKKELGKDSELSKLVERNYNDVHETYGIMEKTMNKTKMKKLNITKEQFNRSCYFKNKYGRLEYVSESGKVFKTSKGKLLKFKESVDWEDDPEYYGDGQLHVFDYGEDCPFSEQYIVMYPSGTVLYTSVSGSVSYWDEGDTMSYSTRSEMEDNFATGDADTGNEYVPTEVSDLTSLPQRLKKMIIRASSDTGYDIDKDVENYL